MEISSQKVIIRLDNEEIWKEREIEKEECFDMIPNCSRKNSNNSKKWNKSRVLHAYFSTSFASLKSAAKFPFLRIFLVKDK